MNLQIFIYACLDTPLTILLMYLFYKKNCTDYLFLFETISNLLVFPIPLSVRYPDSS